jgi:hypothetical protein
MVLRPQRILYHCLIVENKGQLVLGREPVVPVMSMSTIAPDPAIVSLMLDLVACREH